MKTSIQASKAFLLLSILLFPGFYCISIAQIKASKEDSIQRKFKADMKKIRREKQWKQIQDNPIYIGLEFSNPQIGNGFKAKSPWFGPSFMALSGLFHANFQRGQAETIDSGKVYQTNGWSSQFGFRIPIRPRGNSDFQFYPNLGFGFSLHSLNDRRLTNADNGGVEGVLMGLCLSPGMILRAGPLVLTLNYTATIGFNSQVGIKGNNAFNFFNHYPALGVYFTSMPLLMNPKDFTASGKRQYKDLVKTELENSGLTYNKKIAEDQNTITYRKEQIKWVKSTYADRYEYESVKCRDVRPFTYVGPRVSSTWFMAEQMQQAINLEVNAGFRYGIWWMNGYAEQGSVLVKSNAKESDLFRVYKSASYPNLSMQFENTIKVGGQLGIELISRAMKSDFEPLSYKQREEIKSVTSFVGIIPYVGYGLSNLGALTYNSPGGAADHEDFNAIASNFLKSDFDPKSISGNQTFFQIGACLHVGALALGMDWNFYPNAKKLNSRQINLGLNLPIARMIRSMSVSNYVRKIKRMKDE
jgi:hypothetical protein